MNFVNRLRRAFPRAFTLIELITVIAIIAILMGLLLPAVQVVRNAANKARAKADALNIVSAVKSYYTDYGQYPPGSLTSGTDILFGPVVTAPSATVRNWVLMDVLRNVTDTSWMVSGTANLRGVVYLDVPNAQSSTVPKGGIVSGTSGAVVTSLAYGGDFVDPWGTPYFIAVDYSYNNAIDTAIWSDVGASQLRTGVIAFSLGLDGKIGTSVSGVGNGKLNTPVSDDAVSFQ